MSAHRKDITPHDRIEISAKMLAAPEDSRSQLAQQYNLSRPTLYAIGQAGQEALHHRFEPASPPPSPGTDGYWVWVDGNAVKRLSALLRACCGATLSSICLVLLEAFGLHLSEETARQITQESYQRSFEYKEKMNLKEVTQAAFDEMYRWGRCLLTGVAIGSLYIFLSEKQPGAGHRPWTGVFSRLQKRQELNPEQIAFDGNSSIEGSAEKVWPQARLVHDINHLRRAIEKVRIQMENRAYQSIAKAEKMRKRCLKGATRRTSQKQLEEKLAVAREEEEKAIEKSEEVSRWVRGIHGALNIIHPETGHVNQVAWSQSYLQEMAKKFKGLPGTYASWAASYLEGLGQEIVSERAEYIRVMVQVAAREMVSFEAAEIAAHFWELNKQYQGATWQGTREELEKKIYQCWQNLQTTVGEKASSLLESVCRKFQAVLAASSAVEWAHSQISAVLPPQKRVSSGWLCLRIAFLNLQEFREGLRKGQSPHELLTGEKIEDWLVQLGYGPRNQEIRNLKQLGWKRLVQPFKSTWRDNWITPQQDGLSEEVEEVLQEAA